MGRPIKKKFFGNLITPFQNHATGGKTGVGGEGVLSITTATVGSININNSYKTFPSLVVADPQIAGGITAVTAVTWEVDTVTITTGTGYTTGTITSITGLDTYANVPTRFTVTAPSGILAFNAFTDRGEYTSIDGTGIVTWAIVGPTGTNGQATIKFRVKSIAIPTSGTGYNATPSLSWTSLSGTTPSGNTPTLTSSRQDAIKFTSYLTTGSSAINGGDILKQESSRRYLVQNAQGKGQCKLVTTSTLTAGTMNIIATDFNGSTYYVNKLTAHRAIVVQSTASGSFLVGNGISTGWTLGGATGTVVTVAHTI